MKSIRSYLRSIRSRQFGRAVALAVCILAGLVWTSGCAIYREDRCHVEDLRYGIAKDLFVESGSIDIVERRLRANKWQTCEINEILYRLDKEFEIVSE